MVTLSMIVFRLRTRGIRMERVHEICVKFPRFSFDDADGISRALAETGAETVTEVIGSKNRLAVYYLDCPFRAGWNTDAAPVTFLLVYGNDLSFHGGLLLPDKVFRCCSCFGAIVA